MVVELILVFMILFYLKNMKTSIRKDVSRQAVEHVLDMIEPLLKEANDTAQMFDHQIKEKNHLIKNINDKLDSRIISLNLLLNRSETYLAEGNGYSINENDHVYDQQQSVIDMYDRGINSEDIASKLSMPRGEVDLVINLKKKFVSLANDG